MPHESDDLLSTFLDEADEHLAALEHGLLKCSDGTPDVDLLNAVFRAAHSIKGGSGLFGFEAITRLTHALEQLLDRLRKGQLPVTRERIDLLLAAVDGLTGLLAAARDGSAAASVVPADTIRELNDAAGVTQAAAVVTIAVLPRAVSNVYRLEVTPGPHLLTNGMDPFLLLRNLGKRGTVLAVSADLDGLPDLDHLVADRCYVKWSVTIRSDDGADDLRAVFQFVEEDCGVAVTAVPSEDEATSGTGRDGHRPSGVVLAEFEATLAELVGWAANRLPDLRSAVAGVNAM